MFSFFSHFQEYQQTIFLLFLEGHDLQDSGKLSKLRWNKALKKRNKSLQTIMIMIDDGKY